MTSLREILSASRREPRSRTQNRHARQAPKITESQHHGALGVRFSLRLRRRSSLGVYIRDRDRLRRVVLDIDEPAVGVRGHTSRKQQ